MAHRVRKISALTPYLGIPAEGLQRKFDEEFEGRVVERDQQGQCPPGVSASSAPHRLEHRFPPISDRAGIPLLSVFGNHSGKPGMSDQGSDLTKMNGCGLTDSQIQFPVSSLPLLPSVDKSKHGDIERIERQCQ